MVVQKVGGLDRNMGEKFVFPSNKKHHSFSGLFFHIPQNFPYLYLKQWKNKWTEMGENCPVHIYEMM